MKNQRLKFKKVEEEVVVPAVSEEKVVKKADQKLKDPFIFKTKPYRKHHSRLFLLVNPFEPINKGKLGSTLNGELKNQSGSISDYNIIATIC